MDNAAELDTAFPAFAVYLAGSAALLVIDAFTPLESIEWMLHILLVWFVSVACSSRKLLAAGLISSACVVVGALLSPPTYFPSLILLTNRAVVTGAIWIIVYYSLKRKAAEERERSTRVELQRTQQEVKVLRGIIPICAACKRVRTDSGAWQQVEEYISKHSEAEFSHGFCEDCMHVLYPDFREDSTAPPHLPAC